MANYILRHFDKEGNESVIYDGTSKKKLYEAGVKAFKDLQTNKGVLTLHEGELPLWASDMGIEVFKDLYQPNVRKSICVKESVYKDFIAVKKKAGIDTNEFLELATFYVAMQGDTFAKKNKNKILKSDIPWEEEKKLYEDPTDR